MTSAHTVVVGAGIAGLACATELVARGDGDVRVLEAATRAGGAAQTVRRGEYTIERGPNTVRGNAALAALADAAGLALVEARRAPPYVVSNGALVPVPPPLRTLLSGSFVPWSGLASILAEPLRPVRAGPKSVRALVEERFGTTVAERFADLLTLGIYGTSADQVGFESAFPELAASLEQAGGRFARLALQRLLARGAAPTRGSAPTQMGVVSTPLGLGGLCAGLASRLGERLRLSTPVLRARGRTGAFELEVGGAEPAKLACRRLVLAIPAAAASRVLELPGVPALLERYRDVPQVLVTFALEDPACAERWRGLGFLVPSRERLPLLGCLFPSNLFDGRAPRGTLLLSVFAAPALHPASDEEIARALAPLLARLLGAVREPELLDVARYPEGIPLYDVEHRARTRELRATLEAAHGPILCGVGYDGVAFAAAARSGIAAARAVLEAAPR
ncbi:MAG: protoporphyrinogen oxidase [Myxococcota bacterium]